MSFKETAAKIAAAVPELASRQKVDLDPPPAPEPLRSGWETPTPPENPAQIEFQRSLAHSKLYRQPTADELREKTEQANLLAAAWARQR
jgi:hypothetical protein